MGDWESRDWLYRTLTLPSNSNMADRKRKTSGQQDNVFPIFMKKTKHEHNSGPSTIEESLPDAKPCTLKEFIQMLDFSSVTEEKGIADRMAQISRALLHDIRLVARTASGKETEFQVLEAEFYLQIEGIHEDPFTHGSEEQKVSGRWYFHRAPRRSEDSHRSLTSKTAYRDGSRKGMDLTFGAPPLSWVKSKYFSPASSESSPSSSPQPVRELLRGGILLRSIRQKGPGSKVTSGPSLLVDQILAASDATSIEELVENKWEGNISALMSDEGSPSTCLYLRETEPEDRKSLSKVYFSPRIGLDLSHPGTTGPYTLPLHPRIRFLPRLYRFFVQPNLLVANGRPQTFLGVLQSYLDASPSAEAGLLKMSLSSDIARLTGMKDPTAAKYLVEYKAGRKAGAPFLNSVIGPKGKGAGSSPSTYLKMIGAISTLER